MKKLILFAFLCTALISCEKSTDFGPQYDQVESAEIEKVIKGVLVVNEGNFGFGNASISVVDLQKQKIQNRIFENANQRGVGDVAQSVLVVDSLAFVVVNNSNLIHVINLKDFTLVKELKVSGAPRYLVRYKNELLLSSMGSNSLVSISLNDFSVSSKVFVFDWGWLEEMQIKDNVLLACNRTKNTIDWIDLESGVLESQIKVGKDPESIIQDSLGNIWILCTGGFNKNDREKASIYQIKKGERTSKLHYQFSDIENSPTRLRLNKNGDKAYFLKGGVYEINLNILSEPSSLFSQKSGQLFYGLGVNPVNGNLFVSNVNDYVSTGEILVMAPSGILLQNYPAGIIPQAFGFY